MARSRLVSEVSLPIDRDDGKDIDVQHRSRPATNPECASCADVFRSVDYLPPQAWCCCPNTKSPRDDCYGSRPRREIHSERRARPTVSDERPTVAGALACKRRINTIPHFDGRMRLADLMYDGTEAQLVDIRMHVYGGGARRPPRRRSTGVLGNNR